jgi:acyl-CoA synthetase (AMP-forming)/AMP-acid ligase II
MFHAASTGGMMGVIPGGGVHVSIPMFEPSAVLDAIEAEGVTMSIMVPTMIGMMFAHESYRPERLASMRQLAYGASPMPEAILDQLLSQFPDLELIQGYGMTECSATLSFLAPEDHVPGSPRLRSVGRPVFGVTVSIRNEHGKEVATGDVGEVWARGGNWMKEYWNKPEATAEAFVDGWYRTGDAGRLDDEGYLFLVDRVKDMIVTGGENVYSAEVENAISTHPGVAQVAVIGIPDERWGEAVHAIVVKAPEHEITADDVIAHARESIAGYKLPKSVEFRAEPLPLSGAMKVLKRELRAPYWEGRDRSVN